MSAAAGGGAPRGYRPSDSRETNRARRRMMVRYGVSRLEKTGFTGNVSETGLFVRTNMVMPPGTMLQLEVSFPERNWSLWGRVVWAKKVPPQLAHVLDCGMGVCFVDPPEEWYDFFATWKAKSGID